MGNTFVVTTLISSTILILLKRFLGTNSMSRLKCKKCGSVFEYEYKPLGSFVHLGPYEWIRCPTCGKRGFFNVFSSVKDPINYPPQQKTSEAQPEKQLSEEEQEKKRIEESKYERT